MNLTLSPEDAWEPLSSTDWNDEAAGHLLRRIGWSAQAAEIARARKEGLAATLARLFPAKPPSMPMPSSIAPLAADTQELTQKARAADPAERRRILQASREQMRAAISDLTVRWLQRARDPEQAVYEKWTLFLGNVYVVSAQKVNDAAMIFRHQDLLRAQGMGPAPALTKAVLRSPAMINYLDLQQSRVGAPNENFARELMELFTLGIGNYTEQDIKEAARAFTGYTYRGGDFVFAPRRHDTGQKTLFGRTGRYDGDTAIDRIYEQPAAGTHLPARLTRFYLTEEDLPGAHLDALGTWWRGTGFDLRQLTQRYFGSRLFFEAQFRGAFIKSPVQFYLGLLQDFSLDVPPLPRRLEPAFRQMGQRLYFPPNVRGWVGGRDWISSTTLDARRAVARSIFQPLNNGRLNADEQRAVEAAGQEGRTTFAVGPAVVGRFVGLDADKAADRLLQTLLPLPADSDFHRTVADMLRGGPSPATGPVRVRNAMLTILETPEYQLC